MPSAVGRASCFRAVEREEFGARVRQRPVRDDALKIGAPGVKLIVCAPSRLVEPAHYRDIRYSSRCQHFRGMVSHAAADLLKCLYEAVQE
jgi:hypothetical protein